MTHELFSSLRCTAQCTRASTRCIWMDERWITWDSKIGMGHDIWAHVREMPCLYSDWERKSKVMCLFPAEGWNGRKKKGKQSFSLVFRFFRVRRAKANPKCACPDGLGFSPGWAFRAVAWFRNKISLTCLSNETDRFWQLHRDLICLWPARYSTFWCLPLNFAWTHPGRERIPCFNIFRCSCA